MKDGQGYMQKELLPCPHCGGVATLLSRKEEWHVECDTSDPACFNYVTAGHPDRTKIIQMWNKRATPSVSVAPESASVNIEEITKDIADCVSMTFGGIDLPRVKRILKKALEEQEPQPESNAEVPQMALSGVSLIAAERQRQLTQEDWTPEHDDGHSRNEIAKAAMCYIHHAVHGGHGPLYWPWNRSSWKPGEGRTLDTRIRALEKGGALVAAEIDRLLRLKSGNAPSVPEHPKSNSASGVSHPVNAERVMKLAVAALHSEGHHTLARELESIPPPSSFGAAQAEGAEDSLDKRGQA